MIHYFINMINIISAALFKYCCCGLVLIWQKTFGIFVPREHLNIFGSLDDGLNIETGESAC